MAYVGLDGYAEREGTSSGGTESGCIAYASDIAATRKDDLRKIVRFLFFYDKEFFSNFRANVVPVK